MVRGFPVYGKLKAEVASGLWGRPISYAHSFGMNFAHDFPIADIWPERFDPPAVSGGGEMTNMGCYAIDYAVALLGSPNAVQATCTAFWDIYRDAGVENFGQIILDYGGFYALLSVGKQQLDEPRQHSNWLSIQFPHRNFLIEPHGEVLLIDGVQRPMSEYLAGYQPEGSFDELLRCIRDNAQPDSSAEIAMWGVEVLMAAYRSALEGGRAVKLPLEDGGNPLVG
jgi:predicted dehydrogenase